jgi:hypothetical protein
MSWIVTHGASTATGQGVTLILGGRADATPSAARGSIYGTNLGGLWRRLRLQPEVPGDLLDDRRFQDRSAVADLPGNRLP